MIKNFLSKALLSVVMDKSARDNLKTKQIIKKATRELAAGTPSPLQAPVEAPSNEPADVDFPDPLDSLSAEETRQLILDSLKAAEEELGAKPEMTNDRQTLIHQALSIHKSQSHILDDISEEQRQKLTFLALQSLKTDPGGVVAPGTKSKKKTLK